MSVQDSTSNQSGSGAEREERLASVPAPHSQESLVGELFAGCYVIEALLGEGPVGQIYRAKHRDGQLVALKVLAEKHRSDAQVVRRFLRAADQSKALNHPCVARVVDSGTDAAGRPYFCTEYFEGEPVRAAVVRGPLTLRRILEPLCEALSGLFEAHRLGVLHHDLKPQNLLAHEQPSGQWLVRLRDFGMARLFAPGKARAGGTSALTGTMEYQAPEQAHGTELDGRSDVYAVGAILYELLTGKAPQHGLAPTTPVSGALLPSALCSDRRIPDEVDRVCARAIAPDPRSRYQSPRELRNALRGALNLLGARADLPIDSVPEAHARHPRTSFERLTLPGEHLRSRHKLSIGGALLALVCAALWWSPPSEQTHTLPTLNAQDPRAANGNASGDNALSEGQAQLKRGDLDAAIRSLSEAREQRGETAEVARALGEALLRAGQRAEGRRLLERYLARMPEAADRAEVEALIQR